MNAEGFPNPDLPHGRDPVELPGELGRGASEANAALERIPSTFNFVLLTPEPRRETAFLDLDLDLNHDLDRFPNFSPPGFMEEVARAGRALTGLRNILGGLPRAPLADSLCLGLTSGCAFGAKPGSVSTRGSMGRTGWGFGPGCRSQVMAVYPGATLAEQGSGNAGDGRCGRGQRSEEKGQNQSAVSFRKMLEGKC